MNLGICVLYFTELNPSTDCRYLPGALRMMRSKARMAGDDDIRVISMLAHMLSVLECLGSAIFHGITCAWVILCIL